MTDYSKLVEALRLIGKEQDCNECEAGRWHHDFECCLFEDAADAIEALQAKLPKRGEWIYVDPIKTYCSNCNWESYSMLVQKDEFLLRNNNTKFCPNCGAKMFASDTNVLNKNDTMDGPIINPCRGCSDYDGYGGCKSKGGCARAKMTEVQDGE